MNLYELETIREELYSQCLLLDEEAASDKSFNKSFEHFWQELIMDMLTGEGSFYANFIIELSRKIDYTLIEPLSTEPVFNHFQLSINPRLVLECTIREIQALLKHEVYHIISLHHVRAAKLLREYSRLAVNLAMDISVNQYVINLPLRSKTIETVQRSYNLYLSENLPLETYADLIQQAINKKKHVNASDEHNDYKQLLNNNVENFHEKWLNPSIRVSEEDQIKIIDKIMDDMKNLIIPEGAALIIDNMGIKPHISWEKALCKILGSTSWNKKKTIMRRDRRMPDRLDLRGKITHFISEVIVAIDKSGSMNEKEIDNILAEVGSLVRNYNSKITVIECDDEIRNIYKLSRATKHIVKPKSNGKTRFAPVFEYLQKRNLKDVLLIYFTDGAVEKDLNDEIMHNKTLWVITASDGKLSLDNAPGPIYKLKVSKNLDEDTIPLELLKSEMKEIRSEWAK